MPLEITSIAPPLFRRWFARKKWQLRPHQLEMLSAAKAMKSVLLIAPTGSGKTLAGFLPTLIELSENPTKSLHTLYISPLKALTSDILRNLELPIAEMKLSITVETRTGDTNSSRRVRQMKKPPNILLTTPESLELILSYPQSVEIMKHLKRVIIDEIHALAPGKRGHLTSLCMARLKSLSTEVTFTGLSATVCEPEALANWLSPNAQIIRMHNAAPPQIQLLKTGSRVPWSGYAASYAVPEIYKAIEKAKTTIIFVNTRANAELMFRFLWEHNKNNLAIGLHHGSLERAHRQRVEAHMNEGKLRAIIATASLDLGLDWGAVDQVIQIGAPKGISRLLQRIGRSNHQMDVSSKALLVPSNRFEMLECIAVKEAIEEGAVDGDLLRAGTLDVIAQFIMNSACGDGFNENALYQEIKNAGPYRHVTHAQFMHVLRFVSDGGYALKSYERFQRITKDENGIWKASDVARRRHRMNIGTIVEYETLRVRMRRSGSSRSKDLGQVEEYFIQGLLPDDTFIFAGRLLRFKGTRENYVEVEPAKGKTPKIPSFKGGRLPLSPSLAQRVLRLIENPDEWELLPEALKHWLTLQQQFSALPDTKHLLVESFIQQKTYYTAFYTFTGRNANQALGLLISKYLEENKLLPLGFVANDYVLMHWGLFPLNDPEKILREALSQQNSDRWIENSQMAKRAFKDVAVIAGLVERRAPGKKKTGKQVTMSTDLIYDVLLKYEPDHILLQATKQDVYTQLADIERLRNILSSITVFHKTLDKVSPFAVPMLLEMGIEKIKGEAEEFLLTHEARERKGDLLLKKAISD